MSSGMLSLDTCPKDVASLMSVPRGVRYRLAYQLGMFADDSQDQAFNGATDEQQCEALAAGLAQRDAHKGTTQQQMPPMEQPQQVMQFPMQPPQMPMQQMMQPPQPLQQPFQQQMMQPSMGQPVMPTQMPQPPQQPVRQPPQMGMPPQMQPPSMPGMQHMQQPQPMVYAPPTYQAPQPPMPQQPLRQPPGDPGQGTALPIMRTMSEALKKVAEANEANQKWLYQLHEQGSAHTKLLDAILRLLLARYTQDGFDIKLLTGLVGQVKNEELNNLLAQFDGKGKG